MQHRLLSLSVALLMALAPALADTTTGTNTTWAPSNSQTVNPIANQNAQTSNISTQINNQNLGANAYGQGISCQSPQVALGGFGARQSAGDGFAANADSGFSVQYLAPLGASSSRTCQALAGEVLKQRQLDTQLTTIQKCADFARAGITLDPSTYPELSRACAGIRVAPVSVIQRPLDVHQVDAYSTRSTTGLPQQVSLHQQRHLIIHLSDFSPEHNSELRRLAMHRVRLLASLIQQKSGGHHLTVSQRKDLAAHLAHENAHLRAVIAEYQLENAFLHEIARDHSWRASADLKTRLLSYNRS